jgi:hypothetical protein
MKREGGSEVMKNKSIGTEICKAVAITFLIVASVGAANAVLSSQSSLMARENKTTEKPKIKTSMGEFEIEGVQESDRFPPDCENPPSQMCDKASEGYKILIVWLKHAETDRVNMQLYDSSKGVYVTADDGSKTERYSGGGIFVKTADGKDEPRLFIGFTPPKTAQNFKLFWPGNPAFELTVDNKKNAASSKRS